MKDRLREAAHDAILDAAEEVAAERGIDAASCAAIAERAGVAVGTLYNYFPDRDGLLAALFKARRAEMAPEIVAAGTSAVGLPFEDRLRAFVKGAAAAFDKRRRFVRLAIAMDQRGQRVAEREPSLMTVYERQLLAIFGDAETAGEIPRGHHATYARMFLGAMRGLKHHALDHDEPLDYDLLVDVFLHGARTR
jgi:AcrR family transcriptional regulator